MTELTIAAPTLSRRALLTGGGTVLAAAWLFGPAGLRQRPDALVAALSGAARTISVGFVEGVAGIGGAAGRRVMPAARLTASDETLAGGAIRVRLPGLTPASPPTGRSLAVDALLRPFGTGTEPLPFHAWSVTAAPSPRVSSPVAFTAPVARVPSLGFALNIDRPAGDGTEARTDRALAIFTGGGGDGALKLREGLYFLAVEPGVWDHPRALPALDDAAWADLESVVVSVRRAQSSSP